MTTRENEILTSAINTLNWTNYASKEADYYKAQLHSQDALNAFEKHIKECYHQEEWKCGNI